jgi:hypothetical protein
VREIHPGTGSALESLCSGGIWVTNDLRRLDACLDHPADLRFWVELRGFEPLTPSMRSELIAIADRQVLVKSQVRALLLNGWERFGSVHIRDDLPNSSQLIKEENGA